MPLPRLGPKAIKLIEAAVSNLYERIRERVLGDRHPVGKQLYIAYNPDLTLKGIFDAAATEEGVRPSQEVLKPLLAIATSYLDATEARTKARVVNEVQSFLTDAHHQGVSTDLKTVLEGKIYEVMGEARRDVQRIIETESTKVRNVSILDGITRLSAAAGIDDPLVFWVVVRDQNICSECLRLHVLPDGVTPRVWRLSEVGSGYHKKGEDNPKIPGLHPSCRCSLVTLMPGYGFDAGGRVTYVNPGHNEYGHQRSK